MDLEAIKEIIELVNNSNIGEIKIKQDKFKLTVRHKDYHPKGQVQVVSQAPPAASQSIAAVSPAEISKPEEKEIAPVETKPAEDSSKYTTIKSPMIGTFYRSSSPESEPFVKVGDKVQKGDVIGIVEAMKLFNDIQTEISGTIVKVLVENASSIEYDQDLFLVDPS